VSPSFDGEPIFGRLIGGTNGGSFAIGVDAAQELRRRYKPDSALLETQVRAQTGTGHLRDGMVVDVAGKLLPQLILVRHVECKSGHLRVRLMFDPTLGLPGRRPRVSKRGNVLASDWGSLAVALQSSRPLDLAPGTETQLEISHGSALTLVMSHCQHVPLAPDSRPIEHKAARARSMCGARTRGSLPRHRRNPRSCAFPSGTNPAGALPLICGLVDPAPGAVEFAASKGMQPTSSMISRGVRPRRTSSSRSNALWCGSPKRSTHCAAVASANRWPA
jgi:hypothetical protein